jgi:hypothetical protein
VEAWSPDEVIVHGKRGVDANDPRGLPLLWRAYCPIRQIDILDDALTQVMVTVADHSCVYEYDAIVDNRAIRAVADGVSQARLDKLKSGDATRDSGGVHHAKAHKVVLNGAAVDAQQWWHAIQAKIRRVGSLAGLPEFIITGDADTGSRNTLFSAEGPFTRRVAREARRSSQVEIMLLYHAIAHELGRFGDPVAFDEIRIRFNIEARIPIAETKDKSADSARVLNEMRERVISPQMACADLGREYEAVMAEWEEHEARLQQGRESLGQYVGYSADELERRIRAAVALVNAGFDPEESMMRLGLDPVEYGKLMPAGTTPVPSNNVPQGANVTDPGNPDQNPLANPRASRGT